MTDEMRETHCREKAEAVVRNQLMRATAALESLKRDIEPINPRMFEVMSESYVDMINQLRGQLQMNDFPLSSETQHLRNMIDSAESEIDIKVLRTVLRTAADKSPASEIVRMAKALLQVRIDSERGEWVRRN